MDYDKITIRDIALRAGVSKTTVSRVLNDKPDVDEKTRKLILDIIKETGFVPQTSAINLSKGKTGLIGLVVPSLTSAYSLTVIQGVAEKIAETDYELVLYTTSLAEKNQKQFAQRLTKNSTDGLVMLLPRNFDVYGAELARSKVPIVLVDHRGIESQFPSVVAANRQGAREAAVYLLGLGHRHIGFITGLMDFGCSRDRFDGFEDAFREAGVALEPELVERGNFTRQSGRACALNLLRRSPPPTAIFCSNDEMALGAMTAAREMDVKVPDELSIVGFDDMPNASLSVPALTTVRQPLHEMGQAAASLLLKEIGGEAPPEKELVLETSLIVRETCRKI